MIAAVIPAKNEAPTIGKVIQTLLTAGVDLVIPVLNGCRDNSLAVIKQFGLRNIQPVCFQEPLGIDVPRAVGAARAGELGAETILFVDGDMAGEIGGALAELVKKMRKGNLHLALTDCYPADGPAVSSSLASYLIKVRVLLNRTIGLEKELGSASPAHGPHAISRSFWEQIPVRELAIPPVALALAAKKGLRVAIGTSIPHARLGSSQKDPVHCHRIAETIIGDCLEAMQAYRGERRDRTCNGVAYLGYHPERRFDLLEKFLGTITS
ncbi:MAG: glycosyltransferase [Bacillota bacterium]